MTTWTDDHEEDDESGSWNTHGYCADFQKKKSRTRKLSIIVKANIFVCMAIGVICLFVRFPGVPGR